MTALSEELEAYWDNFKKLKVKPADETVDRQVLEIQWRHMKNVGHSIACKWLDPLVEGEAAEAEYEINGFVRGLLVEPEIPMLGGIVRKRRLREYQKRVELIALGRWHMDRGTPVTERDVYRTEPGYKPPTFVWAETTATSPVAEQKRGPGRPKLQEAA